ncbi:C40 family peptidase [uncultured Algibacter sp.]|uniref:C40 family peptidase n=1 Tax=uncultured Algibacter sp. TaxID=298659 RepID=UPI00260218B8|nr:C40 family peptidase [uncultured Algibacter sp.]
MKRILLLFITLSTLIGCKSSKKNIEKRDATANEISASPQKTGKNDWDTLSKNAGSKKNTKTAKSKEANIIDYAKQFQGVRYKWGGTTKAGMDCSGLIYESFKTYDVVLPRISRDMAKKGKKISLKKVHQGDLLFFKTGNRRNSINHVGLIVAIRNNDIEFIHSTSSKGVIISHLNETYWLKAFHEARRVL